jgi:thioester reductase-like protein
VLGAFRVALAEPELPADADFLAAGGDSLRAVSLVAALRTSLGVDVGVQDLLEHPTAAAMTGFVGRQQAAPAVPADERAAMDADALAPLPGPLAPARTEPVRTVLLTGATGFVGAQLAYQLLTRTDATVVCLARAAGDAQARHRVVRALRERGLWRPGWGHRLVGLAGALDRPGLGLRPSTWDELAVEVDAVLHAGALVNFLYDYRAHRGANVLGTAELLRLAQQGRPVPLHHVSTLGVLDREAALHDAPMAEDVDPERVRPPETGYSRSKWVAERLLARARAAGGTVTVLRLGEVMPAAAGPANPRALTHLLLTAFARLRACPDVPLRSDYTPVDWAARVSVAALLDRTAAGRDLHVLHPESVCLTRVLPRAGVALERVEPDEFRRLVANAAADGPPELATLDGILRRLPGALDRLVVDNPALFRADAGSRVAARAGIGVPDLGRAMRGYADRLLAGAEEDACASG